MRPASLIVAVAVVLLAAVAVHAEESSPAERPSIVAQAGHKLLRGIVNLLTGLGELPKQIAKNAHEERARVAIFKGPIDGIGMSIVRLTAGAYELITFPVPVPPNYESLFEPEFVWEADPQEAYGASLRPPPPDTR